MPDKKSDKKIQKRDKLIRLIILLVFLAISTAAGLLHQFAKVKPVGVDALCPFGGIESFYTFITQGVMVKRIVASSFILLIAVIIAAIIFRRTFCGNVCSLGTLQELFARLGKFIFKKRFNVPKIIDTPARYLKYALLILIIVFTVKTGELVIRPYDPWATYNHLLTSELFKDFLFGFIILAISLIGSLIYDRFFCKYLCPMGAFLGAINRIGLFRVKRNEKTCINCNACDKACPVNIPVESLKQVQSSECINCNLCVNACPVKDTLYISGPKNLKISPLLFTIITVIIFAAVVGSTVITGKFEVVQKSLTTEVKKTGVFNPDDIKGRMTLKEVIDASGIEKEKFINEFKIIEADLEVPIKELNSKYSFETEQVREFVKKELEKIKK